MLALAAFTAFSIFYLFAGAPTLRRIPGGAQVAPARGQSAFDATSEVVGNPGGPIAGRTGRGEIGGAPQRWATRRAMNNEGTGGTKPGGS